MKEKIRNGREIYLHMNKKQNGYQNVNLTSFFICGSELLNLLILCDLGVKTSFSGVYCSLSDLQFIVQSKMEVILHVYY